MLDQIDLKILSILQNDGRRRLADIADEVELSAPAVMERVKKLEQKGVILQYTTRINPDALQQKMLAFISMKAADSPGCNDTAHELAKIPEVQEVHHIAGDDCYLVKVRTYDSASLMHLMRNSFSKIPNLLGTRTTIVLETVKEQQQLVIPEK